MPHYLISGIGELVAGVGDVLEREGSSYVGVDDIADVPKACAGAGDRRFDGYVQLPATFTVEGSTAVERIHHFFADGVLARFPAMAAALPVLAPGAAITFVMGVLPPEVSTTDDVAARAALVRVLGHGARADGPPGLRITVLDTGTPAREIALTALGRSGPGQRESTAGPTGRSYADWRTELLGMISAQS